MKSKRNKITLFLACLCAVVYLSSKMNTSKRLSIKTHKHQNNSKSHTPKFAPKDERAPASVDSKSVKKSAKKETSVKSEPAKWEKTMSARLERKLASIGASSKVKALGPREIKKGDKKILAEHVMVSIDRGQGAVSSYEALVDPKTGRVLQTWNRTHFEGAKPLALTMRALKQ